MSALSVLLVMAALAPIRGPRDYGYRWALAEAIASSTDDAQEQGVLARLAWYEGGFRRNVARCEIKGDHGKSLGAFQIQPMSARDARDACSLDLRDQVGLALRYIRRSAEMCPRNVGAARLNLYVSGNCERGGRAAVLRWGDADAGQLVGLSARQPEARADFVRAKSIDESLEGMTR